MEEAVRFPALSESRHKFIMCPVIIPPPRAHCPLSRVEAWPIDNDYSAFCNVQYDILRVLCAVCCVQFALMQFAVRKR